MSENPDARNAPPLGPIRMALLGLGEAAKNIHLAACRRIERVQLVAGADPDPAARLAFGSLEAGIPLFDDPAELLERERPDWVIVAAPPSAHSDPAAPAGLNPKKARTCSFELSSAIVTPISS